ncbi:hypothetical protein [Limnoglobus roseus]|uniref:Uncharacterized protein n=1 Tax=Limnoglobus roseus TaxID=2598579 RepID=A0A5C1ACZ4_9BACT|nr:hypothetical protein [Limnoglobus roseus]QEL15866.1 hypothetical protein PX52LOC_02802 [Limnoglobus roseus]
MSSTALPPEPPDDVDPPDDRPGPNPDDADGNRRGRPTKLTAKLAEAFVQLILHGQFRSTACATLNVSPRTFLNWMRSGRKYQASVYGHFYRAVVSAEAETEAKAVAEVLEAGRSADPKYLVWWLERKFPHRWGRDRGELVEVKKRLKELEELIAEAKDLSSGVENPAGE